MTRLTTVGKVQARGECGVQHRLSGGDSDRPPVWLDPNSVVIGAQSSAVTMRARESVRVMLAVTRGGRSRRSITRTDS